MCERTLQPVFRPPPLVFSVYPFLRRAPRLCFACAGSCIFYCRLGMPSACSAPRACRTAQPRRVGPAAWVWASNGWSVVTGAQQMEAGPSAAPADDRPDTGSTGSIMAAPILEGSADLLEERMPPQHVAAEAPRVPEKQTTRRQMVFTEKTSVFSGQRYRVFTAEEVRRHNTPHDCWLVAHGRVYDVTTFLQRHPAGDRSIMRHAGTDSTIDFDFHPAHAQKMWAPFMLGYVEGHETCTIS